MIRWPFVSRTRYDAVCAELQREQQRARRRETRKPKPAPAGLHAVQDALRGTPPSVVVADVPPEVLEAIEARAGSLTSRTAGLMLQAAVKALAAGQHPDHVAAWMWKGESRD